MDTEPQSDKRKPLHAPRVRRALWLTWFGLLFERVGLAFWPAVSLIAFVLGLALLGLQAAIPVSALRLTFVGLCVLLLLTLAYGAWRFRPPTRAEARARVDATLRGRPLQALEDQPAVLGDAASQGLWQAHLDRMRARLKDIAPVAPELRLAGRDPFALRLMALTTLGLGLMFGSFERTRDLTLSDAGGATLASGPMWEGWIRPPAYSGKPTLYLGDLDPDFEVPKGSDVTLRFYGEDGVLSLRETVSGDDVSALDFAVERSGEIEIDGPTGKLWSVALQPDQAPVAELVDEMTRAPSGEARQEFRVSDDFGVTRAVLTITRDRDAIPSRYGYILPPEPRPAIEIQVMLPQTGDRTEIKGRIAENLAQHPFAGLPVKLDLTAWDASGQQSAPALEDAILPTRRFFDPLAAAIVDQRRELLWNRENAPRTAQVLRAVSADPMVVFDTMETFARLRAVVGQIEGRNGLLTDEQVDEIAAALWDIALDLEDGELRDALDRLHRAQERLSEAMRDGATKEEIARLMQELREATRDYMQQLAEQQGPQDDGTDTPDQGEQGQQITQDQLQQLMDRIQELMEQGRMAEAQQLMDMLAEMLENMRVTQQPGQGQGEGQQGMQGLQNMLRDQQQLNDDTFSDLQEQFGQNGQSQNGQRQGGQPQDGAPQDGQEGSQGQSDQPGQEGQNGQSLAERQEALRNQLQQQRDGIPGGNAPGEDGVSGALERADRAMEEAGEALENGDLSGALDSQAEAMEALREGMRQMGERQQQAENDPEGADGSQAGQGGPSGERRDPLGRSMGEDGQYGSNDPLYEGDDASRRAEELIDEIERRAEDRTREAEERDYLNRLLDQF